MHTQCFHSCCMWRECVLQLHAIDLLCTATVTAAATAVVLPAPSVCVLCVCVLFVCVRLFVMCVPKVLPTRSATH
jgi:hypothetical protein